MSNKRWEINGNLYGSDGLPNIESFEKVVVKVKQFFDQAFGKQLLDEIEFLVDNATEHSGYTPIATVVLNKVVIIKLGIKPDDPESKIVYQFSHELMHVVFRAVWGMEKPRANDFEEAVCSAAALIMVSKICPEQLKKYRKYTLSLSYAGYRKGVEVAESVEFSLGELLPLVKSAKYN